MIFTPSASYSKSVPCRLTTRGLVSRCLKAYKIPWLDGFGPTGPPAHIQILAIGDQPDKFACIFQKPLILVRG